MQTKKRSKISRVRILSIIAVLAIGAYFVFRMFFFKPAARQPAAVLQKTYIEYIVEADGLIESASKTEIYAPSSLRVSEILVREGDAVNEGDLLAVLDTEALELEILRAELNIRSAEANMSSEQRALANSVTNARNSLSSIEISLQTAQREYESLLDRQGNESAVAVASINLEVAIRSYDNSKLLYELGDISLETLNQTAEMLDKAQTSYNDAVRSAQDSLDRARDTLDAAQVRYKSAEDSLRDAVAKNTDPAAVALELQKVAYREKLLRLQDATITAPASGTVTLVNSKVGAPASGLMFVIENERELIVRARVEETDISEISIGTHCRIRPAGRELSLDGVVTLLPVAAERDITGSFSAVIGDDAYFIVESVIESIQPGVLIGMNAKVTFIIQSSEDCFTVPNGLLYREGDSRWVITKDKSGNYTKIPVQTGIETRRVTEIISEELFEGMELYSQ